MQCCLLIHPCWCAIGSLEVKLWQPNNGSHKQWKITHAIICDLVWLTFMSNIKAILKFYVRQMWQGTQQATKNHSLPTTERKKDWSKKDWLLVKRKRNFLFVGKATACKHAYLTRSIRSQNKLPIWKQFGQTTHLVERTRINTHTSSRWVNITVNPDQSCFLGKIKACYFENLINVDQEYLGEKPKCNNIPMKTNAFANISKSLIRPLCLDSSWLEGHWSIMAGPQNHQLSMTMIVVIVIDLDRPSKLTTISTDDRDRC